MSTYKAHIFKQRSVGEREEIKLKIFGPDGTELELDESGPPVTPGWDGTLEWQPYPLGLNGWQDYMDVFPADNFGSPMFAVYGEVVWLRGALYHDGSGGGHLGALPDVAKPFHKQRLNLNQAQAFLSLDIRPDGLLVTGSGAAPPNGHIILSGHYYLTESPDL